MNSAIKGIQLIAETCRRKGIRKVVFSPGSRSAPLVIAFSQIPEIECIVIPDERVAGYFALGLAQQTRQTVAVICTSGTAVLNLLPAACEANYQEVPLLFITADRPRGATEKGENQAIYQESIFAYYALDLEIDADNDRTLNVIKTVEEAIFHTEDWKQPARINVHISEPLYQTVEVDMSNTPHNVYQPEAIENTTSLRIEAHTELLHQLNSTSKKLIVVGLRPYDAKFNEHMRLLAQRNDFAVLVETTSNTNVDGVISNYDSCIELLNSENSTAFVPDVVLTFGNQIISKRIRQLLRKYKPQFHWNIPLYGESKYRDYFELNNHEMHYIREEEALECLLESQQNTESEYRNNWQQLNQRTQQLTTEYLQQIEYSDMQVIDTLVKSFPEGANIQYGNSTPVRYSNIFAHKNVITINSNRGTSGIDGTLSTAAGAAYANKQITICVIGDISFFYDSNALWNNYLSPNLRIVLINNSGGNIFRLLDGPTKVQGFEKFFETAHNLNAQHLAGMYGIPYYFCDNLNNLSETLTGFYGPQNGRPAILEIKTPNQISAAVYKGYYEMLRTVGKVQ